MFRTILSLLLMTIIIAFAATPFAGGNPESFSPFVDSKGAIQLPPDFRASWVHLGSRVVTSQTAAGSGLGQANPGTGFHDVYTQPESLQAYRKNGTWPDGGILLMEVRSITWDDLPTGHVIAEGEPVKWFAMVKDSKGRFPGNTNWGDGWGWALFTAGALKRNISTDYRNDCLRCHEVAKTTDWVFIQGYPALR